MTSEQTDETLLGPIGEAPHVSICMQPSPGPTSPVSKIKGNIIVEFSTTAPVGELGKAMSDHMNLPPDSIILMHVGETLNPSKSLSENNITLPGPAARRRGTKLQIFFDANKDVLDHESQREQAMICKLQQEEALRLQEEKNKQRDQEKMMKLQQDHEKANTELDEYAQTIGISLEIRDRLQAEKQSGTDVEVPPNFLTPCSTEQVEALQQFMRDTGVTTTIHRAYQNVHSVLLHRYRHAKDLLIQGGKIRKTDSTTKQLMPPLLQQDFLGDYDATIGEFAMWHGTTNCNAASSILSSGFDIAYVGEKHGSVWGHGFYFAREARISHGYIGAGQFLNHKYGNVGLMLLCRVLCGNVKHISSPPTMEQKERFTAECLGPGGTFGAKSEYHSICGANWAHVCAHRDQVYPAYVIIYKI